MGGYPYFNIKILYRGEHVGVEYQGRIPYYNARHVHNLQMLLLMLIIVVNLVDVVKNHLCLIVIMFSTIVINTSPLLHLFIVSIQLHHECLTAILLDIVDSFEI